MKTRNLCTALIAVTILLFTVGTHAEVYGDDCRRNLPRISADCNDDLNPDKNPPPLISRERAQAMVDAVKAKRAAANNCGTGQVRAGEICQDASEFFRNAEPCDENFVLSGSKCVPIPNQSSQGSYYERPWTSFFTGETKTVGWTSANKDSYFQDGDIEVKVGTDGRIFFTAYPSNSYVQRGVIAQAIELTPVGRASISASIPVTTCTNYSVTAKPIFTNNQLLYGNAPSAWQLVATKQSSRTCYEPEVAPPLQ